MGTVIKFPRVRGRTETLARTPAGATGASAVIVILPVVRVERGLDAPPGIKARPAKSVKAKSVKAKSVTAKSVTAKSVTAKSAAKAPRKRRKRAEPAALSAPARRRG
jgi:hypothetical protein